MAVAIDVVVVVATNCSQVPGAWDSATFVTPGMQSALAAEKRRASKPIKVDIASLWRDDAREVPVGIDASAQLAFKQIPPECLPQKAFCGRFNFTIESSGHAKVQVQLKSRSFYILRKSGNVPWDPIVDGSPSFAWSSAGGCIWTVWDHVTAAVGW